MKIVSATLSLFFILGLNPAYASELFTKEVENKINMNSFIHVIDWKVNQAVDFEILDAQKLMRNEDVAKAFEVEFANPSREAALLWFNNQGEQMLPTKKVIASNAIFVPNTYALDLLLEAPEDRETPLEAAYYHECIKLSQEFSVNFYRDQLQMSDPNRIRSIEALRALTEMPHKKVTTVQDRCGVSTLMLLNQLNKFYQKKIHSLVQEHHAYHYESDDPGYVETLNHDTGKKLTVKEVEALKQNEQNY